MTLLKIFSLIFGYDYHLVRQMPMNSRQKVVTLGSLMFIPVLLWFISAFYLTHYLLGGGIWLSVLVALVVSFFIFLVDRSFIASPVKGKVMPLFRAFFAIIATLLGSVAIDLMVFQGDLEEFRSSQKVIEHEEAYSAFKADHEMELNRLRTELEYAKHRYERLHLVFFTELDGSGGTGKYGRGAVAKAKQEEMDRAYEKWQELDIAYSLELEKLESEAKAHAAAKVSKRKDALLGKLVDLHDFVFGSTVSIIIYCLFFLLAATLESFFFLYKLFSAESMLEKVIAQQEVIAAEKLDSLMERKRQIMLQDGLIGVSKAGKMRQLSADVALRQII